VNGNEIELLVNRLAGMFPSQQIPKNTIVNTWRNDPGMLTLSASDGRAALTMLESDPSFPSLYRVKQVFRRVSENRESKTSVCQTCNSDGYIMGSKIMFNDREVQTWEKCHCQN
jgi:hypothetical protein